MDIFLSKKQKKLFKRKNRAIIKSNRNINRRRRAGTKDNKRNKRKG